MKRSALNFVVDFIAFLNLLVLALTGLIMKYILPPGSGGLGRAMHDGRGRESIKTLLSLSRHQWGSIHFYLALLFIISMVLHVILHWSWIKSYFKSLLISKAQQSKLLL